MVDDRAWEVGVSAVVVREARVLLARYAYGQRRGAWTLPVGFAQHNETLDQAAVRWLREETGLIGEAEGVIAVRSRHDQQGGAILVAFRMRCQQGEPVPDGIEVDATRFFERAELVALGPIMELSRQIALAALDAPGAELTEAEVPGRSRPAYKAYMTVRRTAAG